jgi:hypothetical protein
MRSGWRHASFTVERSELPGDFVVDGLSVEGAT